MTTPKHRWPRWIHILLQCSLIFVVVFAFLTVLGNFVLQNELVGAIGASSLAATSFIAFVTPDSPSATNRRMIGGYVIALVVGMLGYYAISMTHHFQIPLSHERLMEIVAGVVLSVYDGTLRILLLPPIGFPCQS